MYNFKGMIQWVVPFLYFLFVQGFVYPMRCLFTALCLSFLPLMSFAQSDEDPVQWRLVLDKPKARAGQTLTAQFIGEISPGWHVYAMGSKGGKPLGIKWIRLPAMLKAQSGFSQSKTQTRYDQNFQVEVIEWVYQARIEGKLYISPKAKTSLQNVYAEVVYMACDTQVCLPPKRIPLEVPLKIQAKPKQ